MWTSETARSVVGRVIDGRFRIDAPIAHGGYGGVFRATQLSVERPVAVKLLHSHLSRREDVVARFQREARLTSRIRHANAVSVIDFGSDDDLLYLVMEWIEGETLKSALEERGRFDFRSAASIAAGIASALEAAHAVGMIHRDLKPSNILLARNARSVVPVVVDFGLARIFTPGDEEATLTASNMMIGTPRYMCPESVRGVALDDRSDIYSLGVILYELLAGRTPFRGNSPLDTATRHVTDSVPDLAGLTAASVPDDLLALVMQMLAKSPDDRPQTMRLVRRRLQAYADDASMTPMERPSQAPLAELPGGVRTTASVRPAAALATDQTARPLAAHAPALDSSEGQPIDASATILPTLRATTVAPETSAPAMGTSARGVSEAEQPAGAMSRDLTIAPSARPGRGAGAGAGAGVAARTTAERSAKHSLAPAPARVTAAPSPERARPGRMRSALLLILLIVVTGSAILIATGVLPMRVDPAHEDAVSSAQSRTEENHTPGPDNAAAPGSVRDNELARSLDVAPASDEIGNGTSYPSENNLGSAAPGSDELGSDTSEDGGVAEVDEGGERSREATPPARGAGPRAQSGGRSGERGSVLAARTEPGRGAQAAHLDPDDTAAADTAPRDTVPRDNGARDNRAPDNGAPRPESGNSEEAAGDATAAVVAAGDSEEAADPVRIIIAEEAGSPAQEQTPAIENGSLGVISSHYVERYRINGRYYRTDDSGYVRLNDLPPGEYHIEASADGQRRTADVVVRPGRHTHHSFSSWVR